MGSAGVRRVPVVMDELRGTPIRGKDKDSAVRIEGGYRQIPLDANCYIAVERVVAPRADDSGERLAGHEIRLDFLNADKTDVVIKSYGGDGLKVLVHGKEVFSWRKMDGGASTVRKPVRRATRRRRAVPVAAVVDEEEFE